MTTKQTLKILELFAGTKSIGKAAAELGYDIFSTDVDNSFNTDYTTDLLDFDIKKVPWKPDIIWSSPPCTSFSIASHSHHWTKELEPLSDTAQIGYQLVEKTIEIINHFNPTYWYIENPRGLLRKFPIMKDLPNRNTVNYCQYNDSRWKPTDIWTNDMEWKPRPLCNDAKCQHNRNTINDEYSFINKVESARIPHELCIEILSQLKNNE